MIYWFQFEWEMTPWETFSAGSLRLGRQKAALTNWDDFYDFLLRRNRVLNAVRVLFFAAAAVCLMLGYAFEPQPYNAVAVGALVVALGLSLVIIQNEKKLPPELQNSKS